MGNPVNASLEAVSIVENRQPATGGERSVSGEASRMTRGRKKEHLKQLAVSARRAKKAWKKNARTGNAGETAAKG
jgi:hypothetical protein